MLNVCSSWFRTHSVLVTLANMAKQTTMLTTDSPCFIWIILLAATLSAATKTKSGPCMPIKYSIVQFLQNISDFPLHTPQASSPDTICYYTAKVNHGAGF